MYDLALSYRDKHVEEIYRVARINTITDKIIDKVKAWQNRLFIWLDAIHYKIKDGGKYVSKAVYTVLQLDGKKEILGLYLSENKGVNFWLCVLSDLNNRGLQDILIASLIVDS